jgi:hypothetical protein
MDSILRHFGFSQPSDGDKLLSEKGLQIDNCDSTGNTKPNSPIVVNKHIKDDEINTCPWFTKPKFV